MSVLKVTTSPASKSRDEVQARRGIKGKVPCRSLVGLVGYLYAVYVCFDVMT
jgi:hypothetical protein